MADTLDDAPHDTHPFAPYVRALGRGPGRSRALTRAEARDALGLVLAGSVLPEQVGAFLMLLRYRGESPDEVTGLVEAARAHAGLPLPGLRADLDWPSYADGRTRGLPWFLLAARLVAQAGLRVVLHGPLGGPGRAWFGPAKAAMGLAPAPDADAARADLDRGGLAVLALETLAPGLDRLLTMRGILGLRSPINTVARLLDPAAAAAGFDGVFHPPYIALHLGVAERLGRRLAVTKGAGGEAERLPGKPVALQG